MPQPAREPEGRQSQRPPLLRGHDHDRDLVPALVRREPRQQAYARLDFPIALLGRVSGVGNGLVQGTRLLGRHDAPDAEQGILALCTDARRKTQQLR